MQRRKFIQSTALGTGFACWSPFEIFAGINGEKYPELKKHKITKVERIKYEYHWPRHVGKNAKLDNHGQYKTDDIFKLHTDQGAMGWALGSRKINDEELFQLEGKLVSELISPEKGMRQDLSPYVDLVLHDLMGVILNKPVYELLGAKGTKNTPIYSGMIYFDEMEPKDNPAGLDKILENCQWDIDYGYQQLKVKIGRSGKWYPHDAGLKKDIEVVKLIYKTFPDVELLVDSNDQYTLQDTINFLKGIGDTSLLWVEEPFIENYEDGKKLRQWMDQNGFKDTLYADGESRPNHDLCMKMGKEGIMNTYLPDIRSYGFTWWRNLMPQLKEYNMLASPHAFGNMLKTHYIAHMAAGCGNVVTLEGVTCISDDIDYGDYKIIDGKIQVSEAPGFGMKLLK
ncbi:MAG: mandelate racemase/muconate lactonizing protein [Bacteroidetes bacterium]|nr:MAG: mandelate racemase/muconate lactonizing protein [Bacteroidota bacterium]